MYARAEPRSGKIQVNRRIPGLDPEQKGETILISTVLIAWAASTQKLRDYGATLTLP